LAITRAAAGRLERGGEEVDPEIVGVEDRLLALVGLFQFRLVARQPIGIEALVLFDGGEGHVVDVEGWIGEHVVELAEGVELVRI
jgi:hypothetical protein